MTIVKVRLRDYLVSLPYLCAVADEFNGRTLSATTHEPDAEFGWEGPTAVADSKRFREAIDGSFKRRDASANGGAGI